MKYLNSHDVVVHNSWLWRAINGPALTGTRQEQKLHHGERNSVTRLTGSAKRLRLLEIGREHTVVGFLGHMTAETLFQ
jgi:hypothetical protein